MERDLREAGAMSGATTARDLGDEPPGRIRDAAPDYLAPIDESAPVSGHIAGARRRPRRPPTRPSTTGSARAACSIRPSGRSGRRGSRSRRSTATRSPRTRARATPSRCSTRVPPACRSSTPSTPASFDIVVNGDHLLVVGRRAGRDPGRRDAQPRPPGRRRAPWTDEVSGERRLDQLRHRATAGTPRGSCCPRSSPTSSRSSAPFGRILDRHPGAAPADRRPRCARATTDFAALFAEFIVEQSGGADEPIDRRVFELVDGRLVEFAGAPRRWRTGGSMPADLRARGRRRRSRRSRSIGPTRSTR